MIKRILGGAAATAFAATLLASGTASAHQCGVTSDPPTHNPAPSTNQTLPTGSTVYASGGAGGGYVGIKGGNGWLEVGGAPNASGGYVKGHSTPEALQGKLEVDATPKICVNGQGN